MYNEQNNRCRKNSVDFFRNWMGQYYHIKLAATGIEKIIKISQYTSKGTIRMNLTHIVGIVYDPDTLIRGEKISIDTSHITEYKKLDIGIEILLKLSNE